MGCVCGGVGGRCMPCPRRADEPPTGIPEPSIASTSRVTGRPGGGALRARGPRHHLSRVNYIGEVLGNPDGGFKQGTLLRRPPRGALSGGYGKGHRLEGAPVLRQRLSDPRREHLGQNLGALMPVSFIEATPATRLFEI